MEFAEYRSKVLKCLWPIVTEKTGLSMETICRKRNFSTWTIDNICAVNWKHNNPISIPVDVLSGWIIDEVL